MTLFLRLNIVCLNNLPGGALTTGKGNITNCRRENIMRRTSKNGVALSGSSKSLGRFRINRANMIWEMSALAAPVSTRSFSTYKYQLGRFRRVTKAELNQLCIKPEMETYVKGGKHFNLPRKGTKCFVAKRIKRRVLEII